MELFLKSLVLSIFTGLTTLSSICAAAQSAEFSVVKKPWVALFNGTSSAGKSTIVNEIKKIMSPESLVVVTFDEKMRTVVKELEEFLARRASELQTTVDQLPEKVRREEVAQKISLLESRAKRELLDEVRQALKKGSNVIVDIIVGDGDQYNTLAWMTLFGDLINEGTPAFFVLVYCPIARLAERIAQRNASGDRLASRIPCQVFELFTCLFSSQKSPDRFPMEAFCQLESLDKNNLSMVLQNARLGFTPELVSRYFNLILGVTVMGFCNRFTFKIQDSVIIYPTFYYCQILMNDGTKTPFELANLFLQTTDTPDMQFLLRLAKLNCGLQTDRYEKSQPFYGGQYAGH